MALIDLVLIVFCCWSFMLPTMLAEEPDRLSKEIHQFIYKNEQLCGDQFRDSHWLPAVQHCEMECDMLTEMCQESKKSAFIKAQRCVKLPKRCSDALREALYSLDQSEESEENKIETEIRQFEQSSDQPIHPRGVSVSGTTGESRNTYNNERPLKPFGLDVRLIKASGVSNFRPSETKSSEDESAEPFSTVELLRDFGVTAKTTQKPDVLGGNLIDEILHTSTSSFIQSKLNEDGRSTTIDVDKSYIDKFFEDTFTDFNTAPNSAEKQAPITLPPSPTLKYNSEPVVTSTHSFVTVAPHLDGQSSFISSNNVLEMTAKPFETVIEGQPVGTINQNWPTLEYKTIDNRLEMPPAVPTLSPEVHIFGPPFSSRSLSQPMITMPPLMPTSSQKPASLNYHARDHTKALDIDGESSFGINHFFPVSWRELTNKLKKKPFYSQEDRQEVDQSPSCCTFALEGLCDRSYQRIRAICPKSCGNIVCSSVDGALSCSRAINVDVLDCYERRRYRLYGTRNQRLHQASAPTRRITTTNEDRSVENNWLEQQKQREDKPDQKVTTISMLQRAYAIENEIRAFRKPQ